MVNPGRLKPVVGYSFPVRHGEVEQRGEECGTSENKVEGGRAGVNQINVLIV